MEQPGGYTNAARNTKHLADVLTAANTQLPAVDDAFTEGYSEDLGHLHTEYPDFLDDEVQNHQLIQMYQKMMAKQDANLAAPKPSINPER
jgi:hypothetical protein